MGQVASYTGQIKYNKTFHAPYIGSNGNWYVWDEDQLKYVDSGDSSLGDEGKSPEIRDGYWWAWDGTKWYNTGIKAQGENGMTGTEVNVSFCNSDNSSTTNITTSPTVSGSWGDAPVKGKYRWKRYRIEQTNGTNTNYLPSSSTYYYICVGYTANDGTNGTNGKDGYAERLIFKLSYGKPDKPTGNSPEEWYSSPQKDTDVSAVGVERSGDFVNSGTWVICKGGGVNSIEKIDTIVLSSATASQKIAVVMEVSTEKNYDWGYLSKLNDETKFASSTNASNYASKISDNTYSITEFTLSAGINKLRCGYTKDASKSGTYDYVKYCVLLHKLCWMSKSLTYDSCGNVTSWSEPTLFDTIEGITPRGRMPKFEGDWKAGENYFCTDDFQSIVLYEGSFYLCLQSNTSSAINNPTHATYWKQSAVTGDFVATKVLFAERAKINNLFVDDVETTPTNGMAHSKISGSLMEFFGASGNCNIKIGVNGDGMAILEYYNNEGVKLYDLGPNGLSQVLSGVTSKDGYWETTYLYNFGSSCPVGTTIKSTLWGSSSYTVTSDTRYTGSDSYKRYIFHSGITSSTVKYPTQDKLTYTSNASEGSGNQLRPAGVTEAGSGYGTNALNGWCLRMPPTGESWGVPYSSYMLPNIGYYTGYYVVITQYVNGKAEQEIYVALS